MKPRDHTWIVIGVLIAIFAALEWIVRRDVESTEARAAAAAQAIEKAAAEAQDAAQSRLGEHPAR